MSEAIPAPTKLHAGQVYRLRTGDLVRLDTRNSSGTYWSVDVWGGDGWCCGIHPIKASDLRLAECPSCGSPAEYDNGRSVGALLHRPSALFCRPCAIAASEPSEWGDLPAI